jgi:putative NADPH-quinone reductase
VFRYDTPWTAQAGATETIYWQKQPGTLNDAIDVTWNEGAGHTYKAGGSLAQDRIITLSSTAVTLTAGQPAQATLPSLSLG